MARPQPSARSWMSNCPARGAGWNWRRTRPISIAASAGWNFSTGGIAHSKRREAMAEPLIVIGNGMAAARFVEELAARALGRYAVAVIGEEPRLAYNRVLLSAVLARDVGPSEIVLKSADWWRQRGVTLLYGQTAIAIATHIRRVRL